MLRLVGLGGLRIAYSPLTPGELSNTRLSRGLGGFLPGINQAQVMEQQARCIGFDFDKGQNPDKAGTIGTPPLPAKSCLTRPGIHSRAGLRPFEGREIRVFAVHAGGIIEYANLTRLRRASAWAQPVSGE